jgi:hypothetical protein
MISLSACDHFSRREHRDCFDHTARHERITVIGVAADLLQKWGAQQPAMKGFSVTERPAGGRASKILFAVIGVLVVAFAAYWITYLVMS